MSKTIVLTLEFSDNIEVNNIVDEVNDIIGDHLKYVSGWEWIYK